MIILDPAKVLAARQGSRAALSELVVAASKPVFNLAMRMLAHRQDAEDATQEILVRIVTHLSDIQDVDRAGAWAYRIATRHLTETARLSRVEKMRLGFTEFAADLEHAQADPEHLSLTHTEHQLALKEVKVGCTLAILVCLSRPLRIAYILGEVFEMTDTQACEVLDIPAGTYRQRLRRARQEVSEFMHIKCGVHSVENPCSCKRRITPALKAGRITKGVAMLDETVTQTISPEKIQKDVAFLEGAQRSVAIMRSNPNFTPPVSAIVEELMQRF